MVPLLIVFHPVLASGGDLSPSRVVPVGFRSPVPPRGERGEPKERGPVIEWAPSVLRPGLG